MKLSLIQTAEALLEERLDSERPLSENGRRSLERLASLLSGAPLEVKRIIHSRSIRAQFPHFVPGTAARPQRGPAEWSVRWTVAPDMLTGFGRYPVGQEGDQP